MNKLNIFLSFVLLSFCLLINVSYAEFSTSPSKQWTSMSSAKVTNISYGNYTGTQVRDILKNYVSDISNTQYSDAFNNLCSYLDSYGYDVYLYSYVYNETATLRYYYMGVVKKGVAEFGISYPTTGYTNRLFCLYSLNTVPSSAYDIAVFMANSEGGLYNSFCYPNSTLTSGYMYEDDTKSCLYPAGIQVNYASQSVKNISFNSGFYWDGNSYYYEVSSTPDEPSAPSLPTNAEITQVVQAFYDSDYYKNNTNFKDFMVVYSFVTGYYSIIGTDNHLLQEIYYDGAKPSNDDFTYPETWWRFYNYFGNAQNLFYGWDYWLYSTRKEDDTFLPIKYDGIGKINDLFNLKFTNQSIIVYSSYEYEVYEFRPPTEEGGENQVTNTTVPGNEFTYDENLDPTDSNYSPIQNYIPSNPSQTILGNVDFDEINKTFEENKDILNIEGASWLFTANNKLVGYFIGFLSLLIVFLIISRILGG